MLTGVADQQPISFNPSLHARARVIYSDPVAAVVKVGAINEHLGLRLDQWLATAFAGDNPPIHSVNMTPSDISTAIRDGLEPGGASYKEYVIPADSIFHVAQSWAELQTFGGASRGTICYAPARNVLARAGQELEFMLKFDGEMCSTIVRRFNAGTSKWDIVPNSEDKEAD